jgi:hypothetical protein
MFKLIYTETSLHLELLNSDLATWLERRSLFADSIGEKMVISEEKAAFLLPDSLCNPTITNLQLDRAGITNVTVSRCDVDRVEIELGGYWLSAHTDGIEGVFVAQLPTALELYFWELWNRANNRSISDGVFG